MAVTTFPLLEKLGVLVDLQIHQIARKSFHYHAIGEFPYNLLISVLSAEDGSDNYFINCITGQKISLCPNHAYLLPCHVPVRYERTPDVTVVTMRFNLTFCHGLDIFHGCTDIGDIHTPGLIAFLKKDICRAEGNEAQQLKSAFQLKTMLSHICLSRWPTRLNALPERLLKYEEVFRYVREHGDANMSVEKLAEFCGMRQDVFSRSFKRDTGVSPKRYLADFLVRKISAFLLTTDLTLKEIAGELNFNSEYYLSRFFKTQTRLSPRNYKKHFSAGEIVTQT